MDRGMQMEAGARFLHSIFFDPGNAFCGAESKDWESFPFKAELLEVMQEAMARSAPEAASAEGSEPSDPRDCMGVFEASTGSSPSPSIPAQPRALVATEPMSEEDLRAWANQPGKLIALKPSGSPSHPRASQDSQEVREAVTFLQSLKHFACGTNSEGGEYHSPICQEAETIIAGLERVQDALSQSPKGAPKPPPIKDEDYPHSLDDCIRRMEFLAIEGIADGSRPRIGGLCLSVAEHLERLKRLESPKGAAGARECWVEFDRRGDPLNAWRNRPRESVRNPGLPLCRMVEAAAPSPTTAGGGEADKFALYRDPELSKYKGGEPSAPKTGLRGAGAPGEEPRAGTRLDRQALEQCEDLLADMEVDFRGNGITDISNETYERIVDALRACRLANATLRPAPGDVGEAGGVAT